MTIIYTARLALREITTDDSRFILKLLNSDSFIKYIGRRGINTIPEAEKYISDKFVKSYRDNGFGFYIIELTDSRTPIGICGLVKRGWLDDIDIGFALLAEYEGKGYAFEASKGMLEYSFNKLNIRKIAAITQKNNLSSIKLLKKLGMKERGTVIHPEEEIELMLFCYSAENKTENIKIIRTTAEYYDFRSLVVMLDKELATRDGDEHSFYAKFNNIENIKNSVVLYHYDSPAGCGAFKKYSEDTAEIKRMFVKPELRGKGLARHILSELEKWAAECGFTSCILETGKKQPEAIGLYKKAGYKIIPNYGQYERIDNSICFRKILT